MAVCASPLGVVPLESIPSTNAPTSCQDKGYAGEASYNSSRELKEKRLQKLLALTLSRLKSRSTVISSSD